MDDSSVSQVKLSSVLKHSAYLLFYVRDDAPVVERGLSNRNMMHGSLAHPATPRAVEKPKAQAPPSPAPSPGPRPTMISEPKKVTAPQPARPTAPLVQTAMKKELPVLSSGIGLSTPPSKPAVSGLKSSPIVPGSSSKNTSSEPTNKEFTPGKHHASRGSVIGPAPPTPYPEKQETKTDALLRHFPAATPSTTEASSLSKPASTETPPKKKKFQPLSAAPVVQWDEQDDSKKSKLNEVIDRERKNHENDLVEGLESILGYKAPSKIVDIFKITDV